MSVFLLSFSLLTSAADFAWYAYLFDYNSFRQNYLASRGKVSAPSLKPGAVANSQKLQNKSDYKVFQYLQKNKIRHRFAVARIHDGELMAAKAIFEIAEKMKSEYRDSPMRYILTGRRLTNKGMLVPCEHKNPELVYGKCSTYIMYTPDEVKSLFWQLTDFMNKKPAFTKKYMGQELYRFRNIFKEALLKKQAVYIYGHD